MTGTQAIRTREVGWSWRGKAVTLGLHEAGSGSPVLLPALSPISTRLPVSFLFGSLTNSLYRPKFIWVSARNGRFFPAWIA